MNKSIKKIMTVLMAVIFSSTSTNVIATWSPEYASRDYRNMELRNTKNVRVEKPTAQFAVNRISNGELVDKTISYAGYDCSLPFPELVCYVGDKITFEDLSYDNNRGGKITQWDWQRFGHMGDYYEIYNHNILAQQSFECTQPGETTFFLSVRNNQRVKNGCWDPWSENGNHQVKGTNRWFPQGAYWYFTAVKVIIKPVNASEVCVRYWDSARNKIITSNTVFGPILLGDDRATVNTSLSAPQGYNIDSWNIQHLDGTIESYGTSHEPSIELSGDIPKKNLNVECYVMDNSTPGTETSVDVKYYSNRTQELIAETTIQGNMVHPNTTTTVNVQLTSPEGYYIDRWDVVLGDGTVDKQGVESSIDVQLDASTPHKTVKVYCSKGRGDDDDDIIIPDVDITVIPDGECIGQIEWTETESHRVIIGYDDDGDPIYRICPHIFTYRAILGAAAVITPGTFKSGYGFEVNLDCSLSHSLISNNGDCNSWGLGRAATSRINAPDRATIYLPWTVRNSLGTQGNMISMQQNGNLKFILPESPISTIRARKIYTPVELAGSETNPVSHSFDIYINGGGVGNVEFCKKLTGTITINGVMYDDDFSGAD